jgi:putative PIN family toxin of toxin-antitoxin system
MMNIPRAVLDTNILVSALLSPFGNPAKIYKMFLTGLLSLVYSESIIEEYEDVLHRPRLNIPAGDAAMVLEAIRQYGERAEPVAGAEPMTDEDDRVFYDTAKCSDAYLITGNKRHFPDEPFILTPSEFLEL